MFHMFRVKRLKQEQKTENGAEKHWGSSVHSTLLIPTVSDETVGLFGMSGLNNPIENPLYSPMVIVTRL